MPIKNKDGTPYKLNQPNPLGATQSWFSNVIYHNFDKFKQITSVLEVEEPIVEKQVVVKEPVLEAQPIIEIKKLEEKKIEEKPVVKTQPKNVLIMHGLPSIITEKKDDFYNETQTFVNYGAKILFECMPIENSDFEFKFWSPQPLPIKSIVYPKNYKDGSKFEDFRWWKVNNLENYKNGHIITCIISDYHPDFSD